MAYTPTLIIKYDDLENIKEELFQEQLKFNSETEEVANWLLWYLQPSQIKNYPEFLGTKIIVCTPELRDLNERVRERLDTAGVYYRTIWS